MAGRVFISHSCADDSFVHKVARDLKRRGVPIWISDWHRESGARWTDEIERAILDCPHFLIVLSEDAVESREVQNELDLALEENKLIIPVWHRDCKKIFRLRSFNYEDFREADYAEAMDQLIARLKNTKRERHEPQPRARRTGRPQAAMRLDAPVLRQDENISYVGSSVVLRWNAVPYAESYVVEKSSTDSFAVAYEVYRGPQTSFQLTGRFVPGISTQFNYYRVKAVGVEGRVESSWSNACMSNA